MENKLNPQGNINPFKGRNGKQYEPMFSCGCTENCSCKGGGNPVLKAQQ